MLWSRLDPLVNNSIHPIVVLDNVDYCFVHNFSIGKYGQSKAPDDFDEYGSFITELVTRVVQRYGRARAGSFWWRVATEPNTGRGGTGQDLPAPQAQKIETYVNYYVAVHAAIRRVLPQAVVGPGNFASFFQKGFACNSSSGPHANEGLNLIVPMIQGILSKGGSIGFLATSFYGGDHGNAPGSDTPCARFAGCGYDPLQARAAAEGLRYLRALSPALAAVPLQVQEYAAMVNAHGRGPTYEPGAFGGAWTLASCVEFAARGIDRVFHWDIGFHWARRRGFDGAGHSLFYANAWVMAAARKLFGPSATARRVSVLVVPPGGGRGETLARTAGGGGACGNTSASGIGGALPDEAGVGLLLSVFSPRKDCAEPASVSVSFDCASCVETPDVRLMVLNRTTSVYDQVQRRAARDEGWLQHDDGEVYPLPMMLTAAGLAGIQDTAPHWLAQQRAVFTPRGLAATDGVSLRCGAGRCALSLVAAPPSTFAVWVQPGR